jgi:hypothetical protein
MSFGNILEYIVVVDHGLHSGQCDLLIPTHKLLPWNAGLRIRVGEGTAKQSREEDPYECIRQADNAPEAVIGDIMERLSRYDIAASTR